LGCRKAERGNITKPFDQPPARLTIITVGNEWEPYGLQRLQIAPYGASVLRVVVRDRFDKLLCGCQAHYIRGLFFSYDSFTSRPKRDLLLCVARHRAVTLTRNAPLSKAQSPGISVSRIEPFREFPLPVLPVVESFPGAMSPLGSKEPNEPFLSPHKVFVASRPQKSAR